MTGKLPSNTERDLQIGVGNVMRPGKHYTGKENRDSKVTSQDQCSHRIIMRTALLHRKQEACDQTDSVSIML